MPDPGSRYSYSAEFIQVLREHYESAAEAQGHSDPFSFAHRIVSREDLTLECRREMPISILERYISLPGASILDAGCGTGRNVVLLAGMGSSVIGIDVDTDALTVARDRCVEHETQADLMPADVRSLPFPSSSFDGVVSQNVLEHVPKNSQDQAVSEMVRVLRPGGVLFVQTPNRLSPIDIHSSRLPFLHWLPRKLSRAVRRLGLDEPHEDLASYDEILSAALRTSGSSVLKHCDVWENGKDYEVSWANYSNSLAPVTDLYFGIVPIAYGISRLFGIELNKWLPVLNLFIRKT